MRRRPSEVLGAASESIDRVLAVLVSRLADMSEAQNGWPVSSSVDGPASRGKTTFCEIHGKERCECGGGTPFANLSDPVGESALRLDRAAAHRREVERLVLAIGRDAARLEQLVGLYSPRPATEAERQETTNSAERDVPCWSCSRLSRWEAAVRTAEVAGERRELCWWCFDWVRKGDGSTPSRDQLDRHHRGERVRWSA